MVKGFNGAATFRLRKVVPYGVAGEPVCVASMGPQPFGCGRNIPPRERAALPKLQWGRNLSVAEGLSSQFSATANVMLQWGRNLSVAEGAPTCGRRCAACCFNGAATFRLRKVPRFRHDRCRRRASMGPQPFGCGRREDGFGWGGGGQASMGPQPFGCGRSIITWLVKPSQCFNGAATFRLRKALTRLEKFYDNPALQWGRNLSVAEGPYKKVRVGAVKMLQWGRNLSVAEG